MHAFPAACLYTVPDTLRKFLPDCVHTLVLRAAAFFLRRSLRLSVLGLVGGQLAGAAFVRDGVCGFVRFLAFMRGLFCWLMSLWDLPEGMWSGFVVERVCLDGRLEEAGDGFVLLLALVWGVG